MAASERVPILLPRAQKVALGKKAKAAGLTLGEFFRRAAEAYDPADDEAELDALLSRIEQSTREAGAALDGALERCRASERRIRRMEAARGGRRRAAP